MKTIIRNILITLGTSIMLAAGIATAALATGSAADKVTICHATGSSSNPFVVISPSASGVFNGHLGTSHQDGRDIIPPFTYKGKTYSQNWNAEGQAIFNAGCNTPGTTTTTPGTTTTTPGTTTTTPGTTTTTPGSTTTVPGPTVTVTGPTTTVTTPGKTVKKPKKPRPTPARPTKPKAKPKATPKPALPKPPAVAKDKPSEFPFTL